MQYARAEQKMRANAKILGTRSRRVHHFSLSRRNSNDFKSQHFRLFQSGTFRRRRSWPRRSGARSERFPLTDILNGCFIALVIMLIIPAFCSRSFQFFSRSRLSRIRWAFNMGRIFEIRGVTFSVMIMMMATIMAGDDNSFIRFLCASSSRRQVHMQRATMERARGKEIRSAGG